MNAPQTTEPVFKVIAPDETLKRAVSEDAYKELLDSMIELRNLLLKQGNGSKEMWTAIDRSAFALLAVGSFDF